MTISRLGCLPTRLILIRRIRFAACGPTMCCRAPTSGTKRRTTTRTRAPTMIFPRAAILLPRQSPVVYLQPQFGQGPADITNAGGLSPFGVLGLGGNAFEWGETEGDLVNNSPSSVREIRGGDWGYYFPLSDVMSSSSRRLSINPTNEALFIGFRVASLSPVPEPSTYALVITGLTVLGWSRRRTDPLTPRRRSPF